MDFISKIKNHLPNKNKEIIVGVSGGVDSMTLLDILNKLNYKIHVCHINYNLRDNSNKDYELIKTFCEKNKITLHYKNLIKKINGNIQNEARKIRYKFFKTISDQEKIAKVLLGHHQDDNIETYLLQKERNILVEHYGLQYSREVLSMNVIRPMLDVSKADILSYALSNKIIWNEDETNLKNIYKRNFIRNNILQDISWLKKKKILAEITFINKKTKVLFKICEKLKTELIEENKVSSDVFNLPKPQSTIIIYWYLKNNKYPISRINKKIINEILNFDKKTQKQIAILDLANNFKLKKDHNWYYIIKE